MLTLVIVSDLATFEMRVIFIDTRDVANFQKSLPILINRSHLLQLYTFIETGLLLFGLDLIINELESEPVNNLIDTANHITNDKPDIILTVGSEEVAIRLMPPCTLVTATVDSRVVLLVLSITILGKLDYLTPNAIQTVSVMDRDFYV